MSNHTHLITSHRGVAAIAKSAYLIFSKDWKLDRKGGATPHPQQDHPVPQGPPSSIRC